MQEGCGAGWTPVVDVYETQEGFVIIAELPGVQPTDFELVAEEGRLVLRGQRRDEIPSAQFHRIERGHGPFSRTFEFPYHISSENVRADFRDGVLTISVPRRIQEPRQIRVQA
jgi:HSP20 family protein